MEAWCTLKGAIREVRRFDATFFADIVIRNCTSKSSLPQSICNYISFTHTMIKFRADIFLLNAVTVVCIKVHKIASVWCKTALGEVGVSLP